MNKPGSARVENRFAFGENWRRFLDDIDEARILSAERSLKDMLGLPDLNGRRFLDIGCGSGLFSLAARRLGASVISFDEDMGSVACAEELKARTRKGDKDWRIGQGSVLDEAFMRGLGRFDVVYSWGVLHHTGDLQRALALAAPPVAGGGRLFIAIYNDQGWLSAYWLAVKRLYNTNVFARAAMIALHAPYLFLLRALVRAARGARRPERGMALWRDMLDWLGGLPFEAAKPEAVVAFYQARGFDPITVKRCGRRHGCNEFVFRRR
jgi:2-polyprenyl-3-methyl-5-hydroxy-6-metoxy-1,4-benzoquinol methylase